MYCLEILLLVLAVGVSNLEFLQQFLRDYHDVGFFHDDFAHPFVFFVVFFAFSAVFSGVFF